MVSYGKTITYTRLRENSTNNMTSGGSQLCLLNAATGHVTELTCAPKKERGTFGPLGVPTEAELCLPAFAGRVPGSCGS